MVSVTLTGIDSIPEQEKQAYIERGKEKNPSKELVAVDIHIDGEYVDLNYHYQDVPFQRIRRITGYLVGTTDRWNNAKKAELHDRTKSEL